MFLITLLHYFSTTPFLNSALFIILGSLCYFLLWGFKNGLQLLVFNILVSILVFNPVLVFANTPVASLVPDGTTNTSVDRAANGTPLLNIAAPNQTGLSHNKFSDYNVLADNLVINNKKGDVGNSVLAGVVYGNPNFNTANGREASVILNEVTSNRITRLEGYTEIMGGRADLIIANPSGINIAGAGFINTAKLSIVAGKPNLDANGNIQDFIIGQGLNNPAISNSDLAGKVFISARNVLGQNNVVIPLGLDASTTDYANIIARTISINGEIYANNLNLLTGNDKATKNNDNSWTITSHPLTTNDSRLTTELSIDSSFLGGMYAGRINLIATEAGLGVRTAGDLVADVGDIDISAVGQVRYQNVVSTKGNVRVATNDNLAALNSSSLISAHNNTNIKANSFDNLGEVNGDDVNIDVGSLNNSHNLIANNLLNLKVSNLLTNNGNIYSTNQLNIIANLIDNKNLILANDVAIDANNLINSATINGKNNLNFTVLNLVNNKNISAQNISFNNLVNLTNSGNQAQIYSAANLNFNLDSFNNLNGSRIDSDNNINVIAKNIINDSSLILAVKNLNLVANSISNKNTNRNNRVDEEGNLIFDYGLVAGNDLNLQTTNFDNENGFVFNSGQLSVVSGQWSGI